MLVSLFLHRIRNFSYALVAISCVNDAKNDVSRLLCEKEFAIRYSSVVPVPDQCAICNKQCNAVDLNQVCVHFSHPNFVLETRPSLMTAMLRARQPPLLAFQALSMFDTVLF